MDPKSLYTKHVDAYVSFNSFFRSSQAYRAFFESYEGLAPDLRILDAGCGTGIPTLGLVRALTGRGLGYRTIDAFDLTPAMLARFRRAIDNLRIPNIRFREANVLDLGTLPVDWTDYDLIVSAAMLEYVSRPDLVSALSSLRARLASNGKLLLFITRRNVITATLIERPWKANRYGKEELNGVLTAAGFTQIAFRKFPRSFFWHNYWAHIVEAGLKGSGGGRQVSG